MPLLVGCHALIVAALVTLFLSTSDAKRVHKVSGVGRSDPATISGTVVVEAVKPLTPTTRVSKSKKRMGWSVVIEKDLVLWDELLKDSVSIGACTPTSVTLSGNALDASDYYKGCVFVIDKEDWEKSCGFAELSDNVPDEDDVLFYMIESATSGENSIDIQIKTIDGATVVPEVNLDIGKTPVADSEQVGDVQVTDGTSATVRVLAHVNEKSMPSLPFTSRVSFN